MNMMTSLPPGSAIVRHPERLIALSRVLDALADRELEATIELLIAMRDARDGDPDVEQDGDEADSAWLEQPGRGFTSAQRKARIHEDAEEDDAAESDGDDADTNDAEDDFRHTWFCGRSAVDWHPGNTGAGCPISDPIEQNVQRAVTPDAMPTAANEAAS